MSFLNIFQRVPVKPVEVTRGNCDEGSTERVKVYVRIRPLTEVEKGRGEDQV